MSKRNKDFRLNGRVIRFRRVVTWYFLSADIKISLQCFLIIKRRRILDKLIAVNWILFTKLTA